MKKSDGKILRTHAVISAAASVVGGTEHAGPLGGEFDFHDPTDRFGADTWEKSESEMQRVAFSTALGKSRLALSDLGAIFAGDLLNQCVGSAYGLLDFDVPYFGLYGACSTSAEGLALASLAVSAGYFQNAAVVTSSHNCSAERQYRTPIEYGGQRPPSAQWTVTGAGAFILSGVEPGSGQGSPAITGVLPGIVVDKGITDANNMGAAMAPAALDTLLRYFRLSGDAPGNFDMILTGDLGRVGSEILCTLARSEGMNIDREHRDCGVMIYDGVKDTDVNSGGSGCGCSAAVLAAHILPMIREGDLRRVLFLATGAMMSPSSVQQGLPIPAIAHLVRIESQT